MIWGLLGVLVIVIILMVIQESRRKKKDEQTDYEAMSLKELGGRIRRQPKGKLVLAFPVYDIQKRKQQAILDRMETAQQITDADGNEYEVKELMSKRYEFKMAGGKDGPYIVYEVGLIAEKNEDVMMHEQQKENREIKEYDEEKAN